MSRDGVQLLSPSLTGLGPEIRNCCSPPTVLGAETALPTAPPQEASLTPHPSKAAQAQCPQAGLWSLLSQKRPGDVGCSACGHHPASRWVSRVHCSTAIWEADSSHDFSSLPCDLPTLRADRSHQNYSELRMKQLKKQ